MKRLMIVTLAALGLAIATPVLAKDPAPKEITGATTVDAEKIIEMISEMDDLVIVDSRKIQDFTAGHIEGAKHLVSTDTSAETLATAVPSKETPVLFYCNGETCGRAAVATKVAVDAGYTNVYYYYKGMGEWKELGLPLVTGE